MNLVVLLVVVIGLASFGAAAYLLSIWHEDRRDRIANGQDVGIRSWPLSRVLAYLGIAGTLASNTLAAVTVLRLLNVPNFREIQIALTPLTLTALLVLDVLFTALAVYLRLVRLRGGDV